MKKIKIEDLNCFISDGNYSSKYPRSEEFVKDGIPFIRCNNFKNGTIVSSDMYYITKKKHEELLKGHLRTGDVLITTRGSLGQIAIVPERYDDANINAQIVLIRVGDMINNRYLMWQLKSQNVQRQIQKYKTGTALQQLPVSKLKKIELNFEESLEKQIKIAKKMDCLEIILLKKKKQLEELDKIIKSQFVEMFGHLSENTNKWNELSISEIVNGDLNNGYFAKRDEYVDNGNAEIIGVASVVNRMYSNIDNLPTTNASEKDIEKYRVKYGDLLFCRSSLVAEGIGKASIVPKNVKHNQLFECHVIRMHLNLKKCIPEYIQKLTEDDYFRNQLMKGAKTATMTTIGQGDILKCKVLLPPLELQNKFASFVEQIDKQKFTMYMALSMLLNYIEK